VKPCGDFRLSACASHFPVQILAPGTTISATIANDFTEAVGDLYTSSLIALGLILFVNYLHRALLRALPADAFNARLDMTMHRKPTRRCTAASSPHIMTMGMAWAATGVSA